MTSDRQDGVRKATSMLCLETKVVMISCVLILGSSCIQKIVDSCVMCVVSFS